VTSFDLTFLGRFLIFHRPSVCDEPHVYKATQPVNLRFNTGDFIGRPENINNQTVSLLSGARCVLSKTQSLDIGILKQKRAGVFNNTQEAG
jgi:hypothetical protein